MPATYLKVVLQEAQGAGIPIQPLLANTGISGQDVLTSDEPVSLENTLQVLTNAQQLFGAGWHLQFAERLTVSSHGPLGFAVVTGENIRAAVEVLQRFISTRAPFLWSAGTLEGDEFVLRFYETTALAEHRGTLMEIAALSLQYLLERPLGRTIAGAKLEFAHAAPAYAELFEEAFHADVTFSAEQHAFRIPASWLEEPCALFDQAMHTYLIGRCQEELLATAGVLPPEVAVRQALLSQPGNVPGLPEIAQSQNISARTLMRRLKQANTSYQQILDDVRRTLSRDFLRNSNMTITDIAWYLGFQDPSNFSRAFRSWYDESPLDFRRRHKD